MRPWMRKLGWLLAAAGALGLAWWGWHWPPAPHCELESSTGCEVIGYSMDGKWFAARAQIEKAKASPQWTHIWNARTGEKAQSLPPGYTITPRHWDCQNFSESTWQTIDLPKHENHEQCYYYEFTSDGIRLLPVAQPLEAWFLSRDSDTFAWIERGSRIFKYCSLADSNDGARQIPNEWVHIALAGRGRTLVCHDWSYTKLALWDKKHHRAHVEYSNVEAMAISDDGGFAAIACDGEITVWNLQSLTSESIRNAVAGGWHEDEPITNDVLLVSRNGRRLVAPICGSLQDFLIIDVGAQPRTRRLHLPEPVSEHSNCRHWWLDIDGDHLFVTNENGEKMVWNLANDPPHLVARLNWNGGIRMAATPEMLINNGWTVGGSTLRRNDNSNQGGCIFGAPPAAFLGGKPSAGALGFTGGTTQTGLGFGGGPTYSFSNDSKWLIQQHTTFKSPPTFVQWFGQYFPINVNGTFSSDSELVSLSEWHILGAWADVESTWFSPDGKFIAVQPNEGPISIWNLPPKRQWALPILLTIPVLIVMVSGGLTWRRFRSQK